MPEKIHKYVSENIVGRVATQSLEFVAMAAIVSKYPGNFCEIGTLHGGTAIMVAMFKKAIEQDGDVYTIDPFIKSVAWRDKRPPTEESVRANFEYFGVEDRIHFHKGHHPPLPWDVDFTVAFIDGDHKYESVKADFENLKNRVSNVILYHDNDLGGVQKVIKESGWEEVFKVGHLSVTERPK